MRVRDVMTSTVFTLRPQASVGEAAALLVSHGFTAAPVVDPTGRVVGMVTEADLLRDRIEPEGRARPGGPDSVAAAVMTPAPAVAGPDDDVADVVARMLRARLRSLPVLEGNRLVGILTRRDVLRAVARRELAGAEDWRGARSSTRPVGDPARP